MKETSQEKSVLPQMRFFQKYSFVFLFGTDCGRRRNSGHYACAHVAIPIRKHKKRKNILIFKIKPVHEWVFNPAEFGFTNS